MPTPTPSPTAWTNLQHAASTAGASGVNVDGIITIVIVAASVLAGVLGLSQMSRSKKITLGQLGTESAGMTSGMFWVALAVFGGIAALIRLAGGGTGFILGG